MSVLGHWTALQLAEIQRELGGGEDPIYVSSGQVRAVLEAASAVPVEQLRGAVKERDALIDAARTVVIAFLAGSLKRADIEPLVLALPETSHYGGQ
jgi:hypothetical protein